MSKNPPPSDYCRLCVKSCNDCQRSLYDETGQANLNHELVDKYFTNAMLNMAWEQRLQYICEKCWQHIWEFHQFQESVIEAQKGLHLHIEAAKEVKEVKLKPDVQKNRQEAKLNSLSVKEFSTSTEDLMKSTALTIDIKSEEPLDLNSEHDGMSSLGLEQLTDEEMSLMNTASTNDVESNEDYSSNDELPLSSLSQSKISSSEKEVDAAKRSVEQFDELVALWRSSLKCEICHHLMASYSQLEEHFRKNHASENCYLMCCQLVLESRYAIERHIRYHNAPQQLRCEVCCKAYSLQRYVRRHKKTFHTSKGGDKKAKDSEKLEGKYRCDKCLKFFATEMRLNNHNRDVHKPKIFECNICGKSFMRPIALRDHMANHTGEKRYACSFCSAAFTCQSYSRRHMKKYHLQEWKKKAQNDSAQNDILRGYRRETREDSMVFVCIYCSMEYAKQSSMYSHLRRCQRDNEQKALKKGYRLEIRGESMVCVCLYCSKEYERRHSIYKHVYRCHRNDRSLAKQVSTTSEAQVPIHERRTQFCQDSLSITRPNTTEVSNITSDNDTLNKLDEEIEKEEHLLMTPMGGKELEDENATNTNVKAEQISTDTISLGNEEMDESELPQEFPDATWESEEFIKSEEEFIEL
uniref:Uncharacterized protein n=1 Tax=Stomoxys calcitrans TaxID=35570 RepID=A0A1I8Q9S9_STOCA